MKTSTLFLAYVVVLSVLLLTGAVLLKDWVALGVFGIISAVLVASSVFAWRIGRATVHKC